MDKINWIQKLSSRKFWSVLLAFIGAVAAAIGLSEGSVERITAIVGTVATLITYILVEGNIDAHRVEGAGEAVEGELCPATSKTECEYGENEELLKMTTVTTYGETAASD